MGGHCGKKDADGKSKDAPGQGTGPTIRRKTPGDL